MNELNDTQLKEIEEFSSEIAASILGRFPMNHQSNVMRMIFEKVKLEREKTCKESEISFDEHKKALDQVCNLFTSK